MKIITKYKSLSRQAKAALWFVMCSFLQKGISFVTVPIFTRLLSTEEYGVYSLYLSWLQVLTIFTSLYLYNGVLDNAMAKFKDDRDAFISSMQGICTVIFCTVAIVTAFFYPLVKRIIGLEPIVMLLMFIEMFFTPATNFWMGRQRFEYRYKKLVAITLLKSLMNPILGIVAVSLSVHKDLARISSVVVVEAAIGGILMLYQYYKGRHFYVKKYWSYGIKLAVPMLPHYLSGMILNQGDRIMINTMVGTAEVALYGVAYSIGMLVQLFVTAINSAITPWLYDRMEKHRVDEIKTVSTLLLLFIAGIAIALMLIAPEGILIFGSTKYAEAVYVIPPVAASVFFIFMYSLLSFPQFYYGKTKFLMVASLGAALLNIVLNYIFIKLFGYVAAGYTTLVCYIVYSIGHYLVSLRIIRNELNDRSANIINTNIVLLISVLLILATIVVNFLVKLTAVRYAILTMLLGIIFVKRKVIIDSFRNFKQAKK